MKKKKIFVGGTEGSIESKNLACLSDCWLASFPLFLCLALYSYIVADGWWLVVGWLVGWCGVDRPGWCGVDRRSRPEFWDKNARKNRPDPHRPLQRAHHAVQRGISYICAGYPLAWRVRNLARLSNSCNRQPKKRA